MTAVDAFHAKAATHAAMATGAWTTFARGFTASLRGERPKTAATADDGFTESADEFSRRLSTVLSLAETYYVSPAMNALVTAAAEQWEHDEAVTDEDFPTDHGWLFIPNGGITSIDARGSVMSTNAVTWARHGSAFDVVLWADKRYDPPHLRESEGWAVSPQITPWHLARINLGGPLPVTVQIGKVLPPEVSAKIEWIRGQGGATTMFIPDGWSPDEIAPRVAPSPVLTWLVSALRIMQQPLADVSRVGLPAGVRKRLVKQPRRVKNTAITVIDFRRRVGEYETGTGRTYSHRFLRRGHWRRQPYKREDGTWDRRRIFIHPTIVGDPDKPLMLRNHVNSLSR